MRVDSVIRDRTWRAVAGARHAPAGRRFVTASGRIAWTLLPFAALIVVWQIAAVASGLSSFVFPRPTDVLAEFWDLGRKGILFAYTRDTLWRWLVGALSGALVGIGMGLLFAFNRTTRRAFMPVVRFFSAIAELAFLPLLILWFGFGFFSLVAIIWYTVLFPVLYNLMLGLERVPVVYQQAVRTLGASRWDVVREVLLPGALPSLVAGFRIGAGYAFRALIAAEILAAGSGLGFMIFKARETQATGRSAVGMIVIGLLWLAIDRYYLRPIEAATTERWGVRRGPE